VRQRQAPTGHASVRVVPRSGGTRRSTSAAQLTLGGSRLGEMPAAGGCGQPSCRRGAVCTSGLTPAVERCRA
jgi:hypothetical protein